VRLWHKGRAVAPDALEAWLLRVTRNACYDHLRRRRGRERVVVSALQRDPPPTASHAPDPEVLAASSQLGRRLVEELGRLAEPQRSIVILREIEGLSCRDIGRVVKMSEGSVRVTLHRARRLLRERLQEVHRGAA
jgi:RNA polymerase sigma-70 factor (ECF subfamily)